MAARAAAIGAVALNKIPNVIVTLREGARALDPALDEMARAYRLSPWSKFRNVTLPQLQPYFATASRTASWMRSPSRQASMKGRLRSFSKTSSSA